MDSFGAVVWAAAGVPSGSGSSTGSAWSRPYSIMLRRPPRWCGRACGGRPPAAGRVGWCAPRGRSRGVPAVAVPAARSGRVFPAAVPQLAPRRHPDSGEDAAGRFLPGRLEVAFGRAPAGRPAGGVVVAGAVALQFGKPFGQGQALLPAQCEGGPRVSRRGVAGGGGVRRRGPPRGRGGERGWV